MAVYDQLRDTFLPLAKGGSWRAADRVLAVLKGYRDLLSLDYRDPALDDASVERLVDQELERLEAEFPDEAAEIFRALGLLDDSQ